MANEDDVRRLALALPGTFESSPDLAFAVAQADGKMKKLAWSWKERVHPKKPRVENRSVLVVRVRDLAEKALLIESAPDVFFSEPHYEGYAAVLIRLAAVRVPALRKLLKAAHALVSSTPAKARAKPARKKAKRPAKRA